MTALQVATLVLAALWLLAAPAMRRVGTAAVLACLLLAAGHAVAAAWLPIAPALVGLWFAYSVGLPDARWESTGRRVTAALGIGAGLVWTIATAATGARLSTLPVAVVAGVGALTAGAMAVYRMRTGSPAQRPALHWLAAASVIATAVMVVVLALHAMAGRPSYPAPWLLLALGAIPVAQLLAGVVRDPRPAAIALIEAVPAAGMAVLVCVIYLVLVVGIEGTPSGHERSVLVASLVAAAVVALIGIPVRHRLVQVSEQLVGGRSPSRGDVVGGLGARMSRAIPMDELMLQLVEALYSTVAPSGAEIWTGLDGSLSLTVAVPNRSAPRIELGEQERVVVGRARIGGPAWTAVWLPDLHVDEDHRVVPVAHLGELLGLIVVRRGADAERLDERDEASLVELARQLGLALHNVRLDSALQASLAELAERNEELQASRLRIVTAADSSRRAIERNLHDGAQQHLVALAVKIGLARQIVEDGDTETVLGLLDDLRSDVQTTIGELRELAHGIYPPLLRDRGLNEALRAAAARLPLPCSVDVQLPGRYPEAVETAAYFCCLEAMQNAGKYAGADASVTVEIVGDDESLRFALRDDGAGFDVTATPLGHGFVNMRDRLGAIGGTLTVESSPGAGTAVLAVIPAHPIEPTGAPGRGLASPTTHPAAEPLKADA